MQKEEIKILLDLDTNSHKYNNISPDLVKKLDNFLEDLSREISEDVFLVYKKFSAMKDDAPENMKKNLFFTIQNFINEKLSNQKYPDALFLYRFLMVKSELNSNSFFNLAEILFNLKYKELSIDFIKLYEKKETNKPLLLLTMANFYNLQLKEYKTAIKYYEKYLELDKTKSVIYTITASLYAKAYGDFSLQDQLFYFKKAYDLKPEDRLVLHGLAFCSEKLGDKVNAKKYYEEFLKINPTETDYYNYGAFLINCGDFENGHKYFTHRFFVEDKNLEYPIKFDIERKWDFVEDISEKTLLVHYEQGFGDTFMYCRFIPGLKKLAKKIIFVVQDELYDLIKKSPVISNGINIIPASTDLKTLSYDRHMALLDTPYVLKTNIHTIPYANGYLEVSDEQIKDYAEKYIQKSPNLKAAIAYQGDKSANYNGRDIEFSRLRNIISAENIDFYSVQAGVSEENGVVSLGKTFNNFTDTACALKNMDIVISTDNVILNLAGALGVKTIGLFNKYPNYRWFKLSGSNTGWYNSVIPLQTDENNCWRDVFAKCTKILAEYLQKIEVK